MSLKGHLATIALPELLQWLAIGQKTGTLVIVKDDGVHRIVVDRGRIVSTSTSNPALRLGPWLRRRGLVDPPTLERAFKLREATGMSLGRVLLTLQAVPEDELRGVLHDKAQALISALFHADNASFQFVEDDDLGDPGVALSLDATQLVLSAAHNLEGLPEAGSVTSGDPEAFMGPPAKNVRSSPRPTPEKATATVIETLPEDLALEPESSAGRPRGLRRTWSGVAAAVLLIAAVVAVLLIGRSHVPAKAEESVASPRVLIDRAGGPSNAGISGVAANPDLEFPSAPPAEVAAGSGEQTGLDGEVAVADARWDRLLAEREAELRDEYREELEELRRQLAAARTSSGETIVDADPSSSPAPRPGAEIAVADDEPSPVERAPEPVPISPLPPGFGAPGFPQDDDSAEAVSSRSPGADGVEDTTVSEPPVVARTAARLIDRSRPVYPPIAQRLGREATVTLRVQVGEDGRAERIESNGPEPGLGFGEAARAAARRCRWHPATEDGTPVASWVELRYDFKLP